jgi:hypothetical protein
MTFARGAQLSAAAVLAATLALPAAARGQSGTGSPGTSLPAAGLTVHLTADNGLTGTSPLYVLVQAMGSPNGPIVIANEAGTNQATVIRISGGCGGKPLRHTGIGAEEWCLKVEGLRPGSDSSGTINGDQLDLKLTLGVRHSFWFLPLGVTLVSFAIGLLVAWWTTAGLSGYVNKKLLDAELKANKKADTAQKISGLGEWVADCRETMADKAILPLVRAIRAYGPTHSGAARARLQEALDAAVLDAGPIKDAATAEARRSDNSVDDFYSGATKRDAHPADELIVVLKRVKGIRQELDHAQSTIASLPDESQVGLPVLLHQLRTDLAGAANVDALPIISERVVSDLWGEIDERIASLPPLERAEPELVRGGVMPAPTAVELPAAAPSIWSMPEAILGGDAGLLSAGIATVLTIAALAAIAVAIVASANYLPNTTFGTFADYLALAASAFTSTLLIGVLAAALLWQWTTRA